VYIGKVAIEKASCVIAQVNRNMPRVHGDGFIRIEDVNFIISHDEEVLSYTPDPRSDVTDKIGKYVAHIVDVGDTIQVGYGSLPNAILNSLKSKKHLGVHTELLTDGIVELMRKGIIDNSKKTVNRGKTIATFCMGSKDTYEYIDDNPSIEFLTIDYTNNPLVIAQHENMTAINSALEIDLTGQASAGQTMYSGIGGQADFMRGAMLSRSANPFSP
jgi:acyl-CoA hydrolase